MGQRNEFGEVFKALEKIGYDPIIKRKLENANLQIPLYFFSPQYARTLINQLKTNYPKVNFFDITKNPGKGSFFICVFGDRDISNNEKYKLNLLRESYTNIIPLIIFSKQHFHLSETDDPSVIQKQINTASSLCNWPAPFFDEEELNIWTNELKDFFDYIFSFEQTIFFKKILDDCISTLLGYVREVTQIYSKETSYFKLEIISEIISFLTFTANNLDEVSARNSISFKQKVLEKSGSLSKNAIANIIIKKFPNIKDPWLAEFGLQYLYIRKEIEQFFIEVSKSELGDDWRYFLDTWRELINFSTQISILGTFSSGKTTFINKLLDVPLRTSAKHNTASLSKIQYTDLVNGGQERVEFIYRKEINLNLLSPLDSNLSIESPTDGKIIDIVKEDFATVVIQEENGSISWKFLGTHQLLRNLKIGDSIKKGQKLSSGSTIREYAQGFTSYNSFTTSQIQSLINLIKTKELLQPILEVQISNEEVIEIKNPNEVEKILLAVKQIAKKEAYLIQPNRTNGRGFIKLPPLNQHDIISIDLLGKVSPTNHELISTISLSTKNGWDKYQKGIPGIQETGYAENPSVAFTLDHSKIYLNQEFLKLTNIIDTPGLGSRTELHDEITEKYLKTATGVVLVVISFDAQTENQDLWKLISLIEIVYRNKDQTDLLNIFFLCNHFKNRIDQSQAVSKYFKFKGIIQKYTSIEKPKMYLFDLKEILEKNIKTKYEDPKGVNIPSFDDLQKDLENRIKELGVDSHLISLKRRIKNSLSNFLEIENKKLKQLNSSKEEKERQKSRFNDLMKELKKKKNQKRDELRKSKEKVLSNIHTLSKHVNNSNFKIPRWKKEKDSLVKMAEQTNSKANNSRLFKEIEVFKDEIKFSLDRNDLQRISVGSFPTINSAGIPIKTLKDKIDNVKTSNKKPGLLAFKKRKVYRKKSSTDISKWVEEKEDGLKKDIEKYYDKCLDWIEGIWKQAESRIDNRIHELNQIPTNEITKVENRINQIENTLYPKWHNLELSITKVIQNNE